MTYFTFLIVFLGVPIVLLSLLNEWDRRRGRLQPKALHSWSPGRVIALLCLIAFLYSTPWDNYLVATHVWWYDPVLVTGIVIGFVPIEEYIFFILLPIFTGLLLLFLHKRIVFNVKQTHNLRLRIWVTCVSFAIWITSLLILNLTLTDSRYKPLTYLSLELAWALIPIIAQLAFGADILWRHRRTVLVGIVLSTLYLSATDVIALNEGTWVIDPDQSLQWLIGGILPIEEFVFFGLVNTLVVIGTTLLLAEESRLRVHALGRYTLLRPLVKRMQNISNEPVDK